MRLCDAGYPVYDPAFSGLMTYPYRGKWHRMVPDFPLTSITTSSVFKATSFPIVGLWNPTNKMSKKKKHFEGRVWGFYTHELMWMLQKLYRLPVLPSPLHQSLQHCSLPISQRQLLSMRHLRLACPEHRIPFSKNSSGYRSVKTTGKYIVSERCVREWEARINSYLDQIG